MYGCFGPPSPPPPEPRPRIPVESPRDHRLRQEAKPSWNLDSTGGNIAARFLTETSAAAMLATEDLCWEAATECWKRRKPHRWRPRARAAWKAEGVELAAWAERLRKMADYVFQEL